MTTRPPTKKDDVYGSKTYWRELGNYVSRNEHYERSLLYHDAAIRSTPTDRRALVSRSKSRAKCCQIVGALEDINKALELDPEHLPTLHEKAHNTYISCEFEEALIQNSRLLKFRRKPDYFYIGKMTAETTIENCLGESAGKPLRDHYKIIRKLAWKRNYEAERTMQPIAKMRKEVKHKKTRDTLLKNRLRDPVTHKKCCKTPEPEGALGMVETLSSLKAEKYPIPPLDNNYNFTPLQKYTTNIKRYMAEKYLDFMYLDKVFLKDIQHHQGVKSPNESGNKKLIGLAKAAYSDVAKKQEILRTRRPFYHIKYEEATLSGTLKSRLKEELVLQQQTIKREADKLMLKLRDAYMDRNLNALLEIAEKLKVFCDSKPKRLIPDKDEYLQEIYEKIRRGFYQQNRLNLNQFRWDQDKRICVSFGLPISREPSKDSVICQFENRITDYKNLIAVYEARLAKAEAVEEICWYYHELARFNMDIKQYEYARTYAKKCCNEANTIGVLEWTLNGHMLLLRIHIRQQNKEDALSEVNSANEIAAELKDERLKNYLARCRTVIAELNFELETADTQIKLRERHIMSLMKCEMVRNEFAHLFRTMAALPASRRMSVMPGVRVGRDSRRETKKLTDKQSVPSTGAKISHTKSVTSKKSARNVIWNEDIEGDDTKLLDTLQLYM